MEEEHFINRIFSSASEILKVTPNDALLLKIENQIIRRKMVSVRTFFLCITAVAALLILNIMVINTRFNPRINEIDDISNQIYKSNQLYN